MYFNLFNVNYSNNCEAHICTDISYISSPSSGFSIICQSSTHSLEGMCLSFLYSVISPEMLCLNSVTHNALHSSYLKYWHSQSNHKWNECASSFYSSSCGINSAFLMEWGPYVCRRGPRCSRASPKAVDLNPNTILQILLPLYHTASLCCASVQAGWRNGVCHYIKDPSNAQQVNNDTWVQLWWGSFTYCKCAKSLLIQVAKEYVNCCKVVINNKIF